MQVSRRIEEKEAGRGIDTLKSKTGENIKVLNGAYMKAKIKDNLPVMSGKVGKKTWKFCEIADATALLFKKSWLRKRILLEKWVT